MMLPTWEDKEFGVQLYLGDCMDVLPHLPKVDAVVTDPPYGIDYMNSGGRSQKHGWSLVSGDGEWDKERINKRIFDYMFNVSNDQIIWGGNYYTDCLPPSSMWLIWDKMQRNFSLSDCEIAWVSKKRWSRILSYARGNESGFAPKLKNKDFINVHPTQKPIAVMRWCLGFVQNAETIIDPFLGSGTTGVAAVQLGRKFIGIEIEPKYFEIAVKRISEAIMKKQGGPLCATHMPEQLKLPGILA